MLKGLCDVNVCVKAFQILLSVWVGSEKTMEQQTLANKVYYYHLFTLQRRHTFGETEIFSKLQ